MNIINELTVCLFNYKSTKIFNRVDFSNLNYERIANN